MRDRLRRIPKNKRDQVGGEWFRIHFVRFNMKGGKHKFIFYRIYQILDKGKKVVSQRVYFSYHRNKRYVVLPAGCPPPVVQPPKKKDECSMGYKVGQVISRTVANIVVP